MSSNQSFHHSTSLPSFSPFFDRKLTRGRAASEPQNLFALGDEITSKNAKGQSLLFYAIRFGHQSFAKELMEKGCDPNEADNDSHYPIHEAVDQSDAKMIQLLQQHGRSSNQNQETLFQTLMVLQIIIYNYCLLGFRISSLQNKYPAEMR